MSIILKLSVELDDDFPNHDPDDSLNCLFRDKNLVVDNLLIPVQKKTTIGLLTKGRLNEWITFKTISCECWCGCDNTNNLLFFKIESKQFTHETTKLHAAYSFVQKAYGKDTNTATTLSDTEKEVVTAFPSAAVVKHYSDYQYDTHWDCRCKHQQVCGCGCDSDHDGW